MKTTRFVVGITTLLLLSHAAIADEAFIPSAPGPVMEETADFARLDGFQGNGDTLNQAAAVGFYLGLYKSDGECARDTNSVCKSIVVPYVGAKGTTVQRAVNTSDNTSISFAARIYTQANADGLLNAGSVEESPVCGSSSSLGEVCDVWMFDASPPLVEDVVADFVVSEFECIFHMQPTIESGGTEPYCTASLMARKSATECARERNVNGNSCRKFSATLTGEYADQFLGELQHGDLSAESAKRKLLRYLRDAGEIGPGTVTGNPRSVR